MATTEQLIQVFPQIKEAVLKDLKGNPQMKGLPPTVETWLTALMEKNMLGGKLNRGLFVVRTQQMIVWQRDHRHLTHEEFTAACAVGWAVEALQASFLVADDIMDQSLTRRGEPCWYQRPNPLSSDPSDKIGLWAVNDSLLLESLIYVILEVFFSSLPLVHVQLIHAFHRATYQTELGQFLDMSSQPSSKTMDMQQYNINVYRAIVLYKTSFYSFFLPVSLGMILAGLSHNDALEEARAILLPMGEYFQIQDDYLDCYGDPAVIGKIGRDIEERKCSWMMVQAVSASSPEQLEILKRHYGVDNRDDVAIVKKLFKELNLEKKFQDYEEESYQHLKGLIDATHHVPRVVYTSLLAQIYKRKV